MPKTNRHLATFKFWIPCHSFNFFLFTNLGFFLHIFHNYISSGVVGWERVGTTFPHLSALVALLRTVARNSSLGGLYVCAGRLYVRAGGLDIQIWQKSHWFIMFHTSILGSLELCLGGLRPPNPPRGDGTGLDFSFQFLRAAPGAA